LWQPTNVLHFLDIALLTKFKHLSFEEVRRRILAVDEVFCTETLLKNLQANAPTPDELGKISVFVKGASEDDLGNLSKADAFCAEVQCIIIVIVVGKRIR
jgi:hypothetical protein